MELVLVKALLAPLIVLVASVLSAWLGEQRGGFFVGLPTTSLPFLLAVWMASGPLAASTGARGGVSGQLVCAGFCIVYARTSWRLPPVRAMLAAVVVAAAVGYPTLVVDEPFLVTGLVVVVAVIGLTRWPRREDGTVGQSRRRRRDVLVRMVVACLTVSVMASLEPRLGPVLAGALASLPTILMVMCPSMHTTQGRTAAAELARGTLGSIPGTAAMLAVVGTVAPQWGMSLGIGLGLGALVLVNLAVARTGRCSQFAAIRASATLVRS